MIDYLKDHLWLVWMLITVLALILEVSSGTFYLMCFAIGAACAIVASLFPIPFGLQVLVFIIFSAISVFGVRPFVMKYLHPKHETRLSNADALMGRIGTVSEPIVAGGHGRVAIDGDDWKAVSADGSAVDKGSKVKVVGRESIIITVEKV